MATIKKDIGAYSAYAIAVKHGYRGTEAEWVAAQEKARVDSEAAAKAAQTAQEAAEAAREQAQTAKTGAETAQGAAGQAAQTATGAASAATQAAQAAQTAKKAAEQAQTGAQEARTGAEAAQNGAQAAKTAAEEAAQEAKAAQTGAEKAKTGAETANTEAQAAKTSAEEAAKQAQEALTGAVEAKTGAETAKGKAEEAAQGVAADREQIGANKSGLETAQQELTATKEQLAETKTALATTQEDLKKAQRAIQFQAALNRGQTWDFETDDQEAYQRTVPSGAKAGAVMEIGGKTRRGKNVLPLVLSNNAYNTFATVSGATISVKNTSANTIFPQTEWFELPAGTYCACQSNADVETYFQVSEDDYSHTLKGVGNIVITLDAPTQVRYMLSVTAGINISMPIQTVRGSTPDYDFEPYTPELLSAQVDEMRVRGKNLINPESVKRSSNLVLAYRKAGYLLKKGVQYILSTVYSIKPSGIYIVAMDDSVIVKSYSEDSITYAPDKDVRVYFKLYYSSPATLDDSKLMLEIGAKATAYSPYRDPVTYPIPAAVRNLPGYGWSAGSVANIIERTETGWQYVQRVGSVDLGELSWSINKSVIYGSKYFVSNSIVNPTKAPAFLTAGYTALDSSNVLATDMSCWITFNWGENGRVIIRDDKYTDVASFKTAMSGKPLYYELATPITTDITALMGDALAPFAVEAGGSITMHHPKADEGYEIDVPAKVQYITKLSEVSANG